MERVLVLAAMPLELRPLLAAGGVTPADAVGVGDRTLYPATFGGSGVVLAMTGIGLVNARQTAEAALDEFGDELGAVVFCGVAGSTAAVGDVVVPARWTIDGGESWLPVDPALLTVAGELDGERGPTLARELVLGDAAGLVAGADPTAPITLPHQPVLRVGGDGTSADPFGDEALAPSAGGGDVFGTDPWAEPGDPALAAMAEGGGSTFDGVDPTVSYAAQDMESAAVALVAAGRDVPFLAVRGVSDGTGDPLGLPGFPAQFFAYRHLAAANAAAVTVALVSARTQ